MKNYFSNGSDAHKIREQIQSFKAEEWNAITKKLMPKIQNISPQELDASIKGIEIACGMLILYMSDPMLMMMMIASPLEGATNLMNASMALAAHKSLNPASTTEDISAADTHTPDTSDSSFGEALDAAMKDMEKQVNSIIVVGDKVKLSPSCQFYESNKDKIGIVTHIAPTAINPIGVYDGDLCGAFKEEDLEKVTD